MKFKLSYIPYIVIAILLIYSGIITQRNNVNRSEKQRVSNNYKILQTKYDSKAEVQELLQDEFKKFYPYYDSLADVKNIKTKKIENITNIYHKTVYDTVKVQVNNPVPGTNNRVIEMSAQKECFKTDALLDFRLTDLYPTENDIRNIDLTLTNVQNSDSITTFYYWDREFKKFWFIRLKIGKKQFYAESFSKCDAEIEVESIDIVKKGD